MIKEIEVCCKHRNHIKGNEMRENKLLSVNVFYILCGHYGKRATSDWYGLFVVTHLNICIVCILNIPVF